jgi:hypothetical protein
MDWVQFAVFIFVNLAFTLTLWLWNRSESRNDQRHTETILESQRTLINAIHDEMKDFHARLCVIEDRRTKILER